jgi:hypothetical protein
MRKRIIKSSKFDVIYALIISPFFEKEIKNMDWAIGDK